MDIYENKYSLVLLFINCNFINERIILLYSNNITGLINRQIELISRLIDAIILSNNINV
jgi:hypothetical protein